MNRKVFCNGQLSNGGLWLEEKEQKNVYFVFNCRKEGIKMYVCMYVCVKVGALQSVFVVASKTQIKTEMTKEKPGNGQRLRACLALFIVSVFFSFFHSFFFVLLLLSQSIERRSS